LERDRALRPQVWQYSPNQRDDVCRSDEGWELFILTVIEFCVEHAIDILDMEATYVLRGGRARCQPDHFTTERIYEWRCIEQQLTAN
jgi:hypothetical protein